MQLLCLLVGILTAIILFIQDAKKREISLLWLILFSISGAGYSFLAKGLDFISNALLNCIMVFAILGLILMYYRLKGEKKVMDRLLGWGDIVMMLALAAWFNPWQFSLFYCLSTASLSMLFLLLVKSGRWQPDKSIPLAGLMGLFFSLFFPLYLLLS